MSTISYAGKKKKGSENSVLTRTPVSSDVLWRLTCVLFPPSIKQRQFMSSTLLKSDVYSWLLLLESLSFKIQIFIND